MQVRFEKQFYDSHLRLQSRYCQFQEICPSMGFNTIVKVLQCGIGSTSTVCFPYTFTLSLLMLKLQEENIDLIELLFRSMLSKGQCSQHKSNFDTFAKKKGKIFKVHLSHLQGIKTNYWQLTDL